MKTRGGKPDDDRPQSQTLLTLAVVATVSVNHSTVYQPFAKHCWSAALTLKLFSLLPARQSLARIRQKWPKTLIWLAVWLAGWLSKLCRCLASSMRPNFSAACCCLEFSRPIARRLLLC